MMENSTGKTEEMERCIGTMKRYMILYSFHLNLVFKFITIHGLLD